MASVGVQTLSYQPPEDGAVLGRGRARVDHWAWTETGFGESSSLGHSPFGWHRLLPTPGAQMGRQKWAADGTRAIRHLPEGQTPGLAEPPCTRRPSSPMSLDTHPPNRTEVTAGAGRLALSRGGQLPCGLGAGSTRHCCPAPGTRWHVPAALGRAARTGRLRPAPRGSQLCPRPQQM